MNRLPIITPCHDGLFHSNYVMGLAQAMRSQSFLGYMPMSLESHVDRARSRLACLALDTAEFGPATHFLWVDADIGFNAADFERIASLPSDLHIVGGTYLKKGGDNAPVYRGPMGNEYAGDRDIVQVPGIGFGFCRVSRVVLEALRYRMPATSGGWQPIFKSGFYNGQEWLSEDYYFCAQALLEHGYATYLDRRIRLTHRGNQEVSA